MYKYDREYFKTIDSQEKAYWAGFIAADGNIRKDFLKMRIELNIQDKEHLEKFKKSINGENPIKESIRIKNHSCYIDVNSKVFCQSLNDLGITPNKSLTLLINFDKIPFDFQKDFIRGYFDGDGSLNVYYRQYAEWELSIIGTEDFLKTILKILDKERKLYSCGNNFRFSFKSKKDIKDILDFLYKDATIYLDRKYDKKQLFEALNDYQAAP